MNSKERIAGYLKGERVDRRPNLTIVGSVVTKYTGIDIETYCKNPTEMVRSAVQAAKDLKIDYIQIASDLVREAEAFGSEVAYSPDKLPTVIKPALDDITDVSRLKPLKTVETPRLNDLVKATAYAQSICDDIPTMTLVVGPATVAGNVRGVENFLMDLFDDEESTDELLRIATETALDLIRELAAVGAKYMYVADPVASLFSPTQYEEHILPLHKQIFGEMEKLGVTQRLHMCGNTQHILPYSSQSGAKIIDIDHMVDYAKAIEAVKGRCVLNGNIDPVADVYEASSDCVRERIISVAESIGKARGLFMPGCELPTNTPLENIRAISSALDNIGG